MQKILAGVAALALLGVVGIIATSAPASSNFLGSEADDYQMAFLQYAIKYGRQYSNRDEYVQRLANFKASWDFVENFSSETMTVGINEFSDLSTEEFSERMGLAAIPNDDTPRQTYVPSAKPLPNAVDWRAAGTVTPVKNQASCGSCWAFAANVPTEHLHMKVYVRDTPLALSEQQLVECSWDEGNNGCRGGWFDWAWNYQVKQGITSEQVYPYTAWDGDKCRHDRSTNVMEITGHVMLDTTSDALKQAVVKLPVAVAVGVNDVFRAYTSGVIMPEDGCLDWMVNHAVAAVGYGVLAGEEYYLVKNSWGAGWGDQGYMRISTKGNTCGIHTRNGYSRLANDGLDNTM